MQRPTQPRIPPIDKDSMTESQRALTGMGSSNVVQTLIRHEELFKAWIALGGALLFSERTSPRDRELTVLRVALRTECAYEWANHAVGALGAGATEAELRALSDPSAAWPAADAALLHAVDDLCSDNCVSDETWAALAATRDQLQMIEIVALIGYYRMNAGLLNSIGVQPEPGTPRLGQVPTLPVTSPQPSTTGARLTDTITQASGATPDGTWRVVFHHPTGDQNLTFEIDTIDGAVTGSVSNPALGVTVPIVDGAVDGQRFSFRAPMQLPMPIEIAYAGVVDGETISGEVTIRGAGSFPFDGTRA